MSLPGRVEKENYTASEVEHIVARRIAEQQLIQLQNGQIALEKKLVEVVSSFTSKLDSVMHLIEKQPERMDKCRDELRAEIDKDFPSKLDFHELKKQVDIQWIKITLIVSVVVAVITAIGGAINYWLLVKQLMGS